jgi:hypothetical protein
MYVREAVPDLLASLVALSSSHTEVLVAHGRNRWALDEFLAGCQGLFSVTPLASGELHADCQCSDVDVLRLRRV